MKRVANRSTASRATKKTKAVKTAAKPTAKARTRASAKPAPVKTAIKNRPRAERVTTVQLVAERAHAIADVAFDRIKQRIDQAQHTASVSGLEMIWEQARPILARSRVFVRQHPMRSGVIFGLLACAALLTRTPTVAAK